MPLLLFEMKGNCRVKFPKNVTFYILNLKKAYLLLVPGTTTTASLSSFFFRKMKANLFLSLGWELELSLSLQESSEAAIADTAPTNAGCSPSSLLSILGFLVFEKYWLSRSPSDSSSKYIYEKYTL